METGIPARLSPAEGRKFGLTVGGAFLVMTAILWWRGKHGAVPYVGGLGGALILAGLLVPTAMGPVYRAWMGLAHLLSKVTTPIFMGLVYYVVLTPIGLGMRLAGKNPLVHPVQGRGFWFDRGAETPEPSRMERQFRPRTRDMRSSNLVSELWAFMRVRKKFWLLPILVIMLLVGALLVFAHGSVLAPFIYTIF